MSALPGYINRRCVNTLFWCFKEMYYCTYAYMRCSAIVLRTFSCKQCQQTCSFIKLVYNRYTSI